MSAATFLTCLQSERQHAVDRYEQWLKLREKAVQNAGGKLPEGFNAQEPAPPPPPVDEDDIWDKDEDIEARKHRGDGGAMGPVLSTMSVGDEENSSVLSNLAIAGNVQELVGYLEAHPEADVNDPDDNVSRALDA